VIGRARVRPVHALRSLGLERDRWYPVIEQPADVLTPPLAGYVWLDVHGLARSVSGAFLELAVE
jgi:hypothetical protein